MWPKKKMSEGSNMERVLLAIIELQQDTRKAQESLQKMNSRLEWYIRDYEAWKAELKDILMELLEKKETISVKEKEMQREREIIGEIRSREDIAYEYLKKLGVPAHLKGYNYIFDAILMYNQSEMNSVTKNLYPTIAKKHYTTPSRVERAIRHAIEVICSRADISIIEEIFGYSIDAIKGKPTNSEFIAQISKEIEKKYINQ